MVLGAKDAAKKMGVRPERVLELIHAGRIGAQKVGNRWIIDEQEISGKVWTKAPGRPLSAKSGLALAQALEGNTAAELSAVEKHRLQNNIHRIMGHADPKSQLLAWLSARAQQQHFSVSNSDVPELRQDPRIKLSGVSDPRSGLLPGNEIEAYVANDDVDAVCRDWFLVPVTGRKEANVILRAVDQLPPDVPALFSAMDLAERPGFREQSAASSIIGGILHGH